MVTFDSCMDSKVRSMSISEIKACVNKLMFDPDKAQTDKELFTGVILRSKKQHFDFLQGFTKWNSIGSWRQVDSKGEVVKAYPNEDNITFEVEFRDTPDERVGNKLMDLFGEFNRRIVKEELLYTRTMPIEESSL